MFVVVVVLLSKQKDFDKAQEPSYGFETDLLTLCVRLIIHLPPQMASFHCSPRGTE